MFEVKQAVREATPALIGLWGSSGSGKTYSALLVARGLVGPKGKIVVIDTENGRAKFYASLAGSWQHIDFQPPFTPQRYTEAMQTAEKVSADVIVIDSMSHVWEGEGGVLDMADQQTSQSGRALVGLAKFKAPKTAFKRMMNHLLRSRVHVIFCLRAKELNVQIGKGNDAQIVSRGLVPICEKNFIFEMTVSALLGSDHKPVFENTDDLKCSPTVPSVKAPEEVMGVIKRGVYLSETTGKGIAEWVCGGAPVDQEAIKLYREARNKATEGTVAMRDYWIGLNQDQKKTLQTILAELQSTASQADRDMAEGHQEGTKARERDPLDDAFTESRDAA